MAFDLTTIPASEFMEFRDNWIKKTGLESVGADRLFDDVGLSELVELEISELKEYAKEIGLSVIERKRLIKGIMKLNGLDPKTPATPNPSTPSFSLKTSNKSNKSRKYKKKDKKDKKLKRRRSKSKSPVPNDDDEDTKPDGPMYDPTNKTSPEIKPQKTPKVEVEKIEKTLETLITEAIEKLTNDGNSTKNDIRKTFMDFRTKLTEREMKLLHDVDTTVDKKSRLLQTQLEYVKENNGGGATELACDVNMSLLIEKQDILRTIITAGWVEGASSDNKEEQELQDRERKRRELSRQQYLTVERLKQITLFERDCAVKREDSVRLTNEVQEEIQKINIRTRQCESELAEAKPLLEAAQKLVSTISKTQLNEIRVLKKPPAVVELVMSAVTVMLGNKIKSWKDIQKILSKPTFVASIIEFKTISLKKKTREECKKYVKHQDFNEERANKASKVAGPLVKWVKSQVKYSELLDIVRPMQKEIKVLKKRLNKKQKQAKVCIELVNELEIKISKAHTDINQMVENMIKLQDEYDFGDDIKSQGYNMEVYKTISL